jgi:hypothetical protein
MPGNQREELEAAAATCPCRMHSAVAHALQPMCACMCAHLLLCSIRVYYKGAIMSVRTANTRCGCMGCAVYKAMGGWMCGSAHVQCTYSMATGKGHRGAVITTAGPAPRQPLRKVWHVHCSICP